MAIDYAVCIVGDIAFRPPEGAEIIAAEQHSAETHCFIEGAMDQKEPDAVIAALQHWLAGRALYGVQTVGIVAGDGANRRAAWVTAYKGKGAIDAVSPDSDLAGGDAMPALHIKVEHGKIKKVERLRCRLQPEMYVLIQGE